MLVLECNGGTTLYACMHLLAVGTGLGRKSSVEQSLADRAEYLAIDYIQAPSNLYA